MGGDRAGVRSTPFPKAEASQLKLLYTLIDKKVMTKEEMSGAFAGSTPTRFNAILQRAVKEGKNVKSF